MAGPGGWHTKALKNLKPGKAAGPDRLKPIMIKELREEIAPIRYRKFLSAQLKQASFHQSGVVSRSVLCPKKGDKSSPENYRPISLTCLLCKFLEHIMASHLVKHLNKHHLLCDLQHGFREKKVMRNAAYHVV